jgi:hypothetical protein
MAGSASNELRSAFVAETTQGTTPSTPAFRNLHSPAIFTQETQRFHQESLTAGGAFLGDAMLTKPSVGRIEGPLVYALYDQLWASLFQSSYSSDVLKDGKEWSTLTFENSILAGIGGSRTYMRHRGVEVVGGRLEANARREVRFSMDMIGMQSVDATTSAISGATYSDPANDDPFSAHTDLGAVTLSGFTLDAIASLTIDFIYKGRDIQPKIGGDVLNGIARGAFQPQIKLRCYLDANFMALFNAPRATEQTAEKFTVNLGSVTGKKYRMEFWKCYVDMAPTAFDQPNAFHDITITPRYSSTDTCVMTLTRAIA